MNEVERRQQEIAAALSEEGKDLRGLERAREALAATLDMAGHDWPTLLDAVTNNRTSLERTSRNLHDANALLRAEREARADIEERIVLADRLAKAFGGDEKISDVLHWIRTGNLPEDIPF